MRLLRLPGVFPPHSDSWLLASHLRRQPVPEGGAVLDVCTGSGLLAVVAAGAMRCTVTAVDISRRAVLTAKLNAKLNGVRVNAVRGDLFQPLTGRRFDLIVSNPPYLPTPADQPSGHSSARAWEAGQTGRLYVDRICREAPAHLSPDGSLLLVHSSICGEFQTLEALGAAGLQAAVVDRRPGPLGRRLRARREWLGRRGLIGEDGLEEMLVIRARGPRMS